MRGNDKMLVALTLMTALLLGVVYGACPNKCGGHGRCSTNDVCICMQNWKGGDCSLRVCPFARAWHDTAMADDDAHYYQECSNRGVCDRDKGVCDCDVGFAGSGCRRLACPDDCSGHGTCEFIEDLAGNGYDPRIGGQVNRKYTLWDQEKIMGCRCDPYFEGHNCAKRVCPKGDDPLTVGQFDMTQAIVVYGNTGAVQGYLTYHDPYGMAWTTDAISMMAPSTAPSLTSTEADTACANIETALKRLPNNVLNKVTVAAAAVAPFVRTTATSDSGTIYSLVTRDVPVGASPAAHPMASLTPRLVCLVTFPSQPGGTGLQNLLRCNVAAHNTKGQHPVTTGDATAKCKVFEADPLAAAGLAASTVTVGAWTRQLTELAECSNRGVCDGTTGTCKCYTGHMGLACQKQEALV